MDSEGKKLFKFYREQQAEKLSNKRLFFYRINRWRFDPYDTQRVLRSNKRGWGSLMSFKWGLACYITYRFTLHLVLPANKGH